MKDDFIKSRVIIAAVFILIILFYIGWDSKIYNFDGTVYAFQLQSAAYGHKIHRIFSPYHMLYLPLVWGLYQVLISLGITITAISLMQLTNLALGITTLLIFYKFIHNRFLSRDMALVSTALMAASYVFWFLSHEAETYMLTLFFIVLFFYFLFDHEPKKFYFAKPLTAGILFGLCVLGHIAALMLIFPVIYLLWHRHLVKIYNTIVFVISGVTVIAIPYIFFYRWSPYSDPKTYTDWLMRLFNKGDLYNTDVGFWSLGFKNFYQTFITTFSSIVTNNNVADKNVMILRILQAVIALIILGLLFLLFKNWKNYKVEDKFLIKWSFTWIVPACVLFTIWAVEHVKIRSLILMPVLFLLIFPIFHLANNWSRKKTLIIAGLLVVLIFTTNAVFTFLPAFDAENNIDYIRALWIKNVTPDSALIVILGMEKEAWSKGKIYTIYFGDRMTLNLSWFTEKDENGEFPTRKLIDNYLDKSGPVFALSEVFDPLLVKRFTKEYPEITETEYRSIFKNYFIKPWKAFTADFALYKLEKPVVIAESK